MTKETTAASKRMMLHVWLLVLGATKVFAGCLLGVVKWHYFRFNPSSPEFRLNLSPAIDPYQWMATMAWYLVISGFVTVLAGAYVRARHSR